jgi:methionyl-tRNA formyltransferase
MKQKINTVFISTPDFGVPALQSLIKDNDFAITAVISQPDKKIGRKQILTAPPIKTEALKNNIPVYQPNKIRDLDLQILKDIDLIIVIAYAQIIPPSILELPKFGCINIHASLLPKYRGAACIQAAILNGDTETGLSIIKMDKGLDTGPIIYQEKININKDDTTGIVFTKLATMSGQILPTIIKKYISEELKPKAQDNDRATYVGMLKKSNGKIDWHKTANEIERFIRAMHPWPGANSTVNYQLQITNLKIISTEHSVLGINHHKPGTLFVDNNKLCVQCGKDALVIKQLQLEGKKDLTDKEFLNGHQRLINTILE